MDMLNKQKKYNVLYTKMGVLMEAIKRKKTTITTTVDLGPIEKQISLMTTKINLALSEFSTLPFDTTGAVKQDIDFKNKKVFNLETDTVLGKSAANVKFVRDSIKSIIFPINMNTNAITNLPQPSSLADAATKQYVDTTTNPDNFVKKYVVIIEEQLW